MDRTAASTDANTERLLAQAKRGDPAAFGELYLSHYDLVYGYGAMILKDAHEAEDVTHDVFMRVLRMLPRYEQRPDRPFRVLLLRIARNRAIDYLRKHKRCQPTEPADLADGAPDLADDPPGAFDDVEDAQLVTLLKRLPLSQRQVLVLRYVFDLSTNEVADVVDVTPQAVRNLQYRGLTFLRASLARRPAPLAPAR